MGNIGIWQLLIIAVIVVLLFGTKKLRSLGGDLGSAVKGFKNAIDDDKSSAKSVEEKSETLADSSTHAHQATSSKESQKEKSQA
ncbi:MAG: twin-arginine translocase TatA/TatE family subunit [Litorilituus sp.]|jgi:sec-independent protein translocase protein TatA|nr:twin-arginine translocase TatA/TatE family subunit [Litorilituus sp.]